MGLSEEGGPNSQILQVSEPAQTDGYHHGYVNKYERLLWKFEHIFDFLIEFHEEDAVAIRNFLERMEKNFLMQDPDYRLWIYGKKVEAEDRLKKRACADYQDRLQNTKSVNGS